jgi:hypothetical protein
MLRRNFLSVATAVGGWGLVGQGALAQVMTPSGFGTPAGTVPFGPEVFKERRGRVMQALGTGVAVIYGATELTPANALELATQQAGVGGSSIGRPKGPRYYYRTQWQTRW